MRVAITGANGFVGRELMDRLGRHGHTVVPLVRRPSAVPGEIVTGPLQDIEVPALARILGDVDAVAHLAARTHVLHDHGDLLAAYRRANVAATGRLLDAVAAAGVRRLVYMSSIKVNGEETRLGQRFSGSDVPAPEDAYGQTKFEAEQLITAATEDAGIESVILRPPMVYGAGVGGNFGRLVSAVRRGLPLPFGLVRNRRSFISIHNLADATRLALERPGLNRQIYTLSDGDPVSTRTLVAAIGTALNRPARLVPVPVALLRLAGTMAGRGAEVRRLVGDLVIDSDAAGAGLGWTPGEQLGLALRRMLMDNRGRR